MHAKLKTSTSLNSRNRCIYKTQEQGSYDWKYHARSVTYFNSAVAYVNFFGIIWITISRSIRYTITEKFSKYCIGRRWFPSNIYRGGWGIVGWRRYRFTCRRCKKRKNIIYIKFCSFSKKNLFNKLNLSLLTTESESERWSMEFNFSYFPSCSQFYYKINEFFPSRILE